MELSVPGIAFLLTIFLDIVIYILLVNRSSASKYVALFAVSAVFFVASSYMIAEFNVYSVLLFVISLFRFINLSRVAVRHMHNGELSRRFRRSALWFWVYSAPLVYVIHYNASIFYTSSFAILSLILSIILLCTTIYSLIHWRTRQNQSEKISYLPTVSVCIPARNETQDLPGCIESVLASTYPKLEVLVLDDCSHDKTPTIIKDYAHRGVRFISGQEPNESWVAKNSAMKKLFEESKSDIVIFAGVDVRFSPQTIHSIIEQLENRHLDMISVLPRRLGSSEASVFIQPLRYWWELSVPRLFGKRPPTLSTLWAIRRTKLKKVGGFDSVKHSIRPEAHFAKRLSSAYRFVISGEIIGVSSVKGPREQFDTALRMRYPQARRRPESVFALLIVELVIFYGPIIGIGYGINNQSNYIVVASAISLVILLVINTAISRLSVKKTWPVGLVSLPFLIILEWYVLIRSMIAYEFGIVHWKERNICLPVLQVEKALPKL